MRLITRDDTSLTVALLAAAVILFRQPLRQVLDAVQAIEGRFHLDLLPALLLLVIAFTFHQYRKWVQVRAAAMAATADAVQARTQSRTLQQLMAFSRALADALDRPTLQQVLWNHLPAFAGDRDCWVLIRQADRWELVLPDSSTRPIDELERIAQAATGDGADECFPLTAAGAVVGMLGVRSAPPLTEDHREMLGAAAAVIGIGVKNMQLFLATREQSLRDGLTGCFNRAHALETLDAELRRARRSGHPLSIVMFDVDHFKTVNDRWGHLRGDELLSAIGRQLARITRSSDVRCRYGGDEFLVILPETPSLGAQQVAEMIRQDLGTIVVGDGDASPVTMSIGVAAAVPGELNATSLIGRADEALYCAKAAGRNRVSVAVPPSLASHAAYSSCG